MEFFVDPGRCIAYQACVQACTECDTHKGHSMIHLTFVVIMVILQLWLLTSTMNAYLGGDTSILWPAALASLACLGLNAGLLWYLYRLDA